MKKILILAVILALVISCSFGVVSSAADYSKIDITDYVSGREFVGSDVIVTYDLPLRPYTDLYGFATGSNVPELISSFAGNLYFVQDEIDSFGSYLDPFYYYYLLDFDLFGERNGYLYAEIQTQEIDYDEFVSSTHVAIDGEVYPIVWDSFNPNYGDADGHVDLAGVSVLTFDLDLAGNLFRIYWLEEFRVDADFEVEFGVLDVVNEGGAEYQRINGNMFPLGKTNGATNMIDVRDIRSGYGFTLSFDLRFTIDHDSETDLDGNVATFDAVWLDKTYEELDRSQFEIDLIPYRDLANLQYDIDFTVPDGAAYFYLRLNTGYFYVNTAHEFSWVFRNISMSTLLSSIEESSQTMQKVQQKLDKIDDQLGDIQDSIGDTNDKLDDIVDHVPDPIPPEGSDVIEDTDDIEHDLIDDAIGNLDQLEDVKLSAMEAILLYAGGFACVSTIIDLFARLPFFTGLLYVSLSLGVVSSLLSIANTISSRSGKSHAGKE